MAVDGKIAESARGELPLTWDALSKESSFGDAFLQSKLDKVLTRMFGQVLLPPAQDALDVLVIDYIGKLVALDLINPGIDYWGKQPLTIAATGRNENKGYTARADDLRLLRQYLLQETRTLWPDVEALLPGRRVNTVASRPRVREITEAHTPDPYDFEAPYAPSTRTPREV